MRSRVGARQLLAVSFACLQVVASGDQGAADSLADAISNCTVPFAPQVCLNEAAKASIQRFPDVDKLAYAVLCQFPYLSLSVPQHRQCLVVARSLLVAGSKRGLLLLVPHDTEIEATYEAVLQDWNIQVFRFQPLLLPTEGHDRHVKDGRPNWVYTYNKLVAWSLDAYSKVVVIDYDSVVLENIDFLFGLTSAAAGYVGADCTPHYGKDDYWGDRDCHINSGLFLAQPGRETFEKLASSVANGWDHFSQSWKWYSAEQTILEDKPTAILRLPYLSPNLQQYPDVCYRVPEPTKTHPMRRMSVLHYTWLATTDLKAYNMEEMPENECWTQFRDIFRYFDNQVPRVTANMDTPSGHHHTHKISNHT
ncbi:hypothetical protein WJX73_006219 [Symbiochloris irregularis]|uniref:Hexosyltransferase n=1 Tax=Symbiochloris irregularis TaxID=706552 RepID=A0AAW1NLT1_9CHLO